MDLDAYRRTAEAFVSELTSEYYRHYAGLQDTYEIESIYERHEWLFTRGTIDALRELTARAAASGDERRGLRMLVEFAVEGHLGQATKQVEAELARREAALSIEADGERIGFRESAVAQANEPDGERRARIERARLEATDQELNPLYRELLASQHATAHELGFASYRSMCEELKGVDLAALERQTAAFTAATETRYPGTVEPELRRTLGVGLADMRRSDLPRFFRAAEQDQLFGADRLVASLTDTLRGLGIEVGGQAGVVLDVDTRPNKSPRAFCAPVRVPDQVYLVIAPTGGRDDFEALFHEAGHTEHYACVDPALAFEFRYLGDNAITESFAFLIQHLVDDPEWLARHLDVADPEQLASHARAKRLIYLRRYAAKLAYELELHESGPADFAASADRYSQLLRDAVGIPWPRETFLADVDPSFYCSCYLRAWALETHLRKHLQGQFGPAWFESAEAGDALRELWREGQRLTPEELLGQLTSEPLDFAVLLES
jgi:hypothetical protein